MTRSTARAHLVTPHDSVLHARQTRDDTPIWPRQRNCEFTNEGRARLRLKIDSLDRITLTDAA
jgi:hypothetical protein